MLLVGEGSEATEPYNKYDRIRPHSIRSLQFDQKVRLLSFRPEKIVLLTATRISRQSACDLNPSSYLRLTSSTLVGVLIPGQLFQNAEKKLQ